MDSQPRKRLAGIAAALLAAAVLVFVAACGTASPAPAGTAPEIRVVASFFPMYDLARKVAGDRAQVSLLVTPGAEPHSCEPAAADIVRLERADLFVYNGAGMEHWAQDVLQALTNKEIVTVEASAGLPLIKGGDPDHEGEGFDPHVWLSPPNEIGRAHV